MHIYGPNISQTSTFKRCILRQEQKKKCSKKFEHTCKPMMNGGTEKGEVNCYKGAFCASSIHRSTPSRRKMFASRISKRLKTLKAII